VARSVARFAFSYDIWEERFSITKIGPNYDPRRSHSHLTGPAAEAWFIANITVDRSQLPADREFWVPMDLRTEAQHDQTSAVGGAAESAEVDDSRRHSRPNRCNEPKNDRRTARAAQGKLVLWQAFIALLLALVVGGFVQFWLARGPGRGLLYRFGRYIGLTSARLDAAAARVKKGGIISISRSDRGYE